MTISCASPEAGGRPWLPNLAIGYDILLTDSNHHVAGLVLLVSLSFFMNKEGEG